ncbi:MAG: Flp pilus assembly complex ATPase component TadA [Candidatus Lokiarchaeota archaeon]|nr:Flp pilus assembly complex ATPase component TadA [Candidatus Lokiarchaeota archaeon]
MNSKFVCDTSVIFNGQILRLIEDGDLGEVPEIYIPNVVVAEIEYRSNIQKEIGFFGINVLKKLRDYHKTNEIILHVSGDRPTRDEIKMSPGGELDALIRQEATKNNATLITTDRIQGDIGIFEGLDVFYVKDLTEPQPQEPLSLKLLEFFDENTMSVHLKRYLPPYAKKGAPGNWRLEKISDDPISNQLIEDIALEIVEYVREDEHSFIEIDKLGALVTQMREFRIVITRPPFSNDIEITAVRPLVNLELSDYSIDINLKENLEKAEGILVCGAPGAGKSTFAAALANHYLEREKVVKTLESVRDLQVRPEITQYTKLEGNLENSADILLLVRPDFTIYDEVRTTKDFEIYTDFRLSGVGMVGVVHSSSAIDAIQRFIGRVELGMLPSIIDTIIFIEGGDIQTVLGVKMTVKVPSGFKDKDLARPVVEVRDFKTNNLVFEVYSFGQDIVLIPINPTKSRKNYNEYKNFIESEFKFQRGERINLDIQVKSDKILVIAPLKFASTNIQILVEGKLLFTGSLSRNAEIKIALSNIESKHILKALNQNKNIYGSPK